MMKRQMDDLLMLVDLHDDHLHDEHHDNYLDDHHIDDHDDDQYDDHDDDQYDDHHDHLHKLEPFFMQVGYLGPFDHHTLEPSYVRI